MFKSLEEKCYGLHDFETVLVPLNENRQLLVIS